MTVFTGENALDSQMSGGKTCPVGNSRSGLDAHRAQEKGRHVAVIAVFDRRRVVRSPCPDLVQVRHRGRSFVLAARRRRAPMPPAMAVFLGALLVRPVLM